MPKRIIDAEWADALRAAGLNGPALAVVLGVSASAVTVHYRRREAPLSGGRTGQRQTKIGPADPPYGLLTVPSVTDEHDPQGRCYVPCRCQCGREEKVRSASLLGGNTRSCGLCHRRRTWAARQPKGTPP